MSFGPFTPRETTPGLLETLPNSDVGIGGGGGGLLIRSLFGFELVRERENKLGICNQTNGKEKRENEKINGVGDDELEKKDLFSRLPQFRSGTVTTTATR